MAYTPNPSWVDQPSTLTPIMAALLNHLEAGLVTAAAVADDAHNIAATLQASLGAASGIATLGSDSILTSAQRPTGGSGGASTAAAVSYDPTTSTGGDANTPMIPAFDVQTALDWQNREMTDRDQQTYLAAVRDTLRLVYALANATAQVTTEGTIPGLVQMPGQPTATGQALKVLSGAGTQASPWVYGWA